MRASGFLRPFLNSAWLAFISTTHGSSIIDAGGIAGGHGAFLVQRPAELRHAVEQSSRANGYIRRLSTTTSPLRVFTTDRNDLVLEATGLSARVSALYLRLDRKLILLLARMICHCLATFSAVVPM